ELPEGSRWARSTTKGRATAAILCDGSLPAGRTDVVLCAPLRTDLGRAKVLLAVFIVTGVVGCVWLARQSYAVYKLTRGVGDTWSSAADGKQWCRLDEERQDVPLQAISPRLQEAFVAVEDHRFFMHPG